MTNIEPSFADLWDAAGVVPGHPYAEARREWEAVLSSRIDLDLAERAERLGVSGSQFAMFLLATNGDLGLASAWALDHSVWSEADRLVPRFSPDDVAGWLSAGWCDADRAVAWDMAGFGPRSAIAWSRVIWDEDAPREERQVGVDPDAALAAIAGGWPELPSRFMPRTPGDLDEAMVRGSLLLDG